MTLSKRLQAVADRIPTSPVYVDIGCDHGYLPIYVVSAGVAQKAIATDLRKGPLERAREHVRACGLEDKIELRQSDGADALSLKDSIDTISITGMGGRLLLRIMERGHGIFRAARDIIISPQSDIPLVRERLTEDGFTIVEDVMVEDAGKYYVILHLKPQPKGTQARLLTPEEKMYGACLRERKDPVLYEYLLKEQKQTRKICEALKNKETAAALAACEQAERKLEIIGRALRTQETEDVYGG